MLGGWLELPNRLDSILALQRENFWNCDTTNLENDKKMITTFENVTEENYRKCDKTNLENNRKCDTGVGK